jgi:hypothetical protein
VRRHELDAVSLVAGGLFLVVAAVNIVAGATDTVLNLHWMVPALLVLLGAVGLLSVLRSSREVGRSASEEASGEPAAAPTDQPAEASDPAETAVITGTDVPEDR